MRDRFVLGPATLALGDGNSVHGRIAIERGRIIEIITSDGPSDVRLPSGVQIAPGLIDVHTNGAGELLFNRDQKYAVPVASAEYARQGVTAYLAGIMTAPFESMLHAAAEVAEAAHQLEEEPPRGARCIGIHFEGPFLNPKFRRIHQQQWILTATPERARALIEAAKGTCLMVTMAPEVEGVGNAARIFLEHGIVCSAGHTAARYSEGMLAIGLGFRSLTHAFNAMPPLDHRDPSILAAFIQDGRTTVQVICDGYHVAPVMIDILHRTLGERLVLATDAMPSVGAGYHIEGGVVRAEDGTIAGSAIHMDESVRNFAAYTELSFARAIVAATHAPAKMLGLDREMGRIARGMRADLSFWDEQRAVVGTMVGGVTVFGEVCAPAAA